MAALLLSLFMGIAMVEYGVHIFIDAFPKPRNTSNLVKADITTNSNAIEHRQKSAVYCSLDEAPDVNINGPFVYSGTNFADNKTFTWFIFSLFITLFFTVLICGIWYICKSFGERNKHTAKVKYK